MKKRHLLTTARAFAALAMVYLFSVGTIFGQGSFIYEAFTQAWLHPGEFDEFIAENQSQFTIDYQTCSANLIDYFRAIADEEAHELAYCSEQFDWDTKMYLSHMQQHPGAGLHIFLADMGRAAFSRDKWLDTPSGRLASWLQEKIDTDVFRSKQAYYLKVEEAQGTDAADRWLYRQRMLAMDPLLTYLAMMEAHFNCYYY